MHDHYAGDPYWTVARFNSTCKGCKARIKKGRRIFYYPRTMSVFCSDCGAAESASFTAAAEDEYLYNHRGGGW